MSTNAPTPAAPAPTNGAAGKTQGQPAPKTDTATGPQTPSGQPRAPDGKFAPPKPGEGAAQPPEPEYDFGEGFGKLKASAARRELERARHASRLLTEAERRARAADEKDKAHEARKAALREGRFDEAFADAGLTAEQQRELVAQWYYKNHVEPAQLTEEQRRVREAERERDQAREQLKARQEAEAKQQEKQMAEQAEQELEAEFLAALDAGKVPKARAAIRKVAARIERFEARGLKLPIEQHVAAIREEVGKETGEFVSAASVDDLRALWGDEVFKPVAQKFIDWAAQLVRPRQEPAAPRAASPFRPKPQDKKHISPQEFKTKFK